MTPTPIGGRKDSSRRWSCLSSLTTLPLLLCLLVSGHIIEAFSATSSSSSSAASAKPVLVVGATGKVGRRVVQQLLSNNTPVRALVRSKEKAFSIFGTTDELQYPSLQVVQCDLGTSTKDSLRQHVEGCQSIISVSGALRFSKWSDFLPWRLLRSKDATWSKDVSSHPYYLNYAAQANLIDLAEECGVERFVRLTGLSCGLSPFSFVSMLFNSVLSLTTRWHLRTEDYLRASKVPYVILRPGGLAENERVRFCEPSCWCWCWRWRSHQSLVPLDCGRIRNPCLDKNRHILTVVHSTPSPLTFH